MSGNSERPLSLMSLWNATCTESNRHGNCSAWRVTCSFVLPQMIVEMKPRIHAEVRISLWGSWHGSERRKLRRWFSIADFAYPAPAGVFPLNIEYQEAELWKWKSPFFRMQGPKCLYGKKINSMSKFKGLWSILNKSRSSKWQKVTSAQISVFKIKVSSILWANVGK